MLIVISLKIMFVFKIQSGIWLKVWRQLQKESINYEIQYGKKEVETFLDAVLAIEEHIDPSLMRPKLAWTIEDEEEEENTTNCISLR